MRTGVRLGIDVGKARIGVARCDPHGVLATPVETVARSSDGSHLRRLAELADDYDALEMVVGLPLSLSGTHTPSTDDAEAFAGDLAAATGRPSRLVDERLSTVSAQVALRATGKSTKGSRSIIDQAAATVILQHALDTERTSGEPPGTLATPTRGTIS